MYTQVKSFSKSDAGTRKGWCLQNVRKGFDISAKYDPAIQAWQHTQQHKTRQVPAGVYVPLFYTYLNYGHVNVRMANGTVWSDGVIYSSIEAYEKQHPQVHYVGWGESINDVRVLKWSPDPIKTYVVRSGDYLSKIAAKFGTTWQKLYAKPANKKVIGSDPNKIKPGEKLDVSK